MATKTKGKGYDAPNILVDRVEAVPCADLTMFHKNPRVGNVEKIAESLKKNGQFKPIVVNVGTETGRPNEILAGNHTWLGTKRNGDDLILAAFVDVDEETATRINLADNATADAGEYDDSILADLLATLPDATGTGYSQSEFDNLLATIDTSSPDLGDIDTGDLTPADLGRKPKFEEAPLGEEDEADAGPEPTAAMKAAAREAEEQASKDHLAEAKETMRGAFQLQDMLDLRETGMVGYWGVPRIRTDEAALMQPDEVPANLDSWAGSATRDWPDEDQWWLYNYGVDSTSGMKDISKVILSFYTYDDYFEKWWWTPAKYTTKVLNSRIKYILSPDFSQDPELGRAQCLWQLYRSRYLSRFFQEAGLKLVPHLTWPDGDIDFLEEHVLGTFPGNGEVPVLAFQLQTLDEDEVVGGMDHLKKQLDMMMEHVKPEVLILYAGKPGYEFFRDNVKHAGTRIQWVNTRQAKLSEKAKGREKKTTL